MPSILLFFLVISIHGYPRSAGCTRTLPSYLLRPAWTSFWLNAIINIIDAKL